MEQSKHTGFNSKLGVILAAAGSATAIEKTAVDTKAVKRIVNGQLLIEKNGKIYNAQGAEIR